MAKKSEEWLVSYGDCITLLICLLITIVVVLKGQSEEDIEWVAEQVADITNLIQEAYPDTNIFKIYPRASSFKVTLTGNIFESCKDKLNYDVIPLISSLGKDLIQNLHELNVMEKPDFIEDSLYLEISIEGHTDSLSLPRNCGNFDNNWQLSASRAYETMKVIADDKSINEELRPYIKLISVRGYADSHPICKIEVELKNDLIIQQEKGDEVAINMAKQKLASTDFTDCYERNRRTEVIFTAFLMGSNSTYYSDSAHN